MHYQGKNTSSYAISKSEKLLDKGHYKEALNLMLPWVKKSDMDMMVTDDNRTLWLVIGVMTLAVMVFAGGHFYSSAWKSLKNRTATMDTLVALGTGAAWLPTAIAS